MILNCVFIITPCHSAQHLLALELVAYVSYYKGANNNAYSYVATRLGC